VTGGAGGGQVGFVVDVDDPIGANVTQIDNTVEVGDDGANGPDPNPGDNVDSDSTPVTQVDMQVDKDDGGATIQPGGSITYRITFTNAGFTNASGVVLTETITTRAARARWPSVRCRAALAPARLTSQSTWTIRSRPA
jgi:uncharacterized repeat protein (TIGR01451 family)